MLITMNGTLANPILRNQWQLTSSFIYNLLGNHFVNEKLFCKVKNYALINYGIHIDGVRE